MTSFLTEMSGILDTRIPIYCTSGQKPVSKIALFDNFCAQPFATRLIRTPAHSLLNQNILLWSPMYHVTLSPKPYIANPDIVNICHHITYQVLLTGKFLCPVSAKQINKVILLSRKREGDLIFGIHWLLYAIILDTILLLKGVWMKEKSVLPSFVFHILFSMSKSVVLIANQTTLQDQIIYAKEHIFDINQEEPSIEKCRWLS